MKFVCLIILLLLFKSRFVYAFLKGSVRLTTAFELCILIILHEDQTKRVEPTN